MKNYKIGLLKGDGIGPEIIDSAVRVLEAVGKKRGIGFTFTPYLIGGAAIDECGIPLPQETVDGCLASDSVLLGAVGGPKWDNLPGNKRPEKALLGIRAAMGLFTNLRPAKLYPALKGECPLREDIVANGFDIMIVRELTGGIYFGEHKTENGTATDVLVYTEEEIERIGRIGFETARKRGKKLCSIEKSNVLDSSRLWKAVMHRLAEEYPDSKIITVDTLCASAGQGLLLYHVLEKKKAGATIEEAAQYAKDLVPSLCHWFTVDDLVYLKRGGRISPAAAFVGNLIGIKPVLHVDDEGHLVNVEKVRGRRASIMTMASKYGELSLDKEGSTIFISHADCKADAQLLAKTINERYGATVKIITDVGPVIGAHSGPGTLALFFVGKYR